MTSLLKVPCWALLAATMTMGSAAAAEVDPVLVSFATGPKTGVYYSVGGAICARVNEGRWEHGIRCVTESSDGSIANLNALSAGSVEFALVQSDWHHIAYAGEGPFAEAGPFRRLRSVMSLHTEPFTVVATRESGIAGIDDLQGKRVNIGVPGAGRRATMEVVMAAMGWSRADFAVAAEIPVAGQARALCDNEVDAVTFVIGHPNRAIEELVAACDARLIPVVGPEIETLVRETAYYRPVTIPGGLYPGIPNPTPTFGVTATVVTTSQVGGRIVDRFVGAVFDDLEGFRDAHPVLADLDAAAMRQAGLEAPLHAGAQSYHWRRRRQPSSAPPEGAAPD